MKSFAYGIAVGLLAVFTALGSCYATMAIFAPTSIPAPAITKLNLLDEKLRFLRRHPEFDPTILAVGSSVTWRQLAGKAFVPLAGGRYRFLNGATGYLKIHQTRALAKFYLAHYPDVRELIVMVSLPDFEDCTHQPAAMLEPEDAARYTFDDWPPLYFYLRYFSPMRYAKSAMTLAQRQVPFSGDFYIDKFGSGPVELPPTVDLGLRYGKIKIDDACVSSLVGIEHDMADRGIRLVLVFTPVHPEYRALYPAAIKWLTQLAAKFQRTQRKGPAGFRVIDLVRDPEFGPDDFYDAFHLQWPAVQHLSGRIVQAIRMNPVAAPQQRVISQSVATRMGAQ
jgi:hypothetical protein